MQGLQLERGPDGSERIKYQQQGYEYWDWNDTDTGRHRVHYISAGAPRRLSAASHSGGAVDRDMLPLELGWVTRLAMSLHTAGLENTGAPTILLVHGFGASAYHWRANIPALVAAGHRVFAIDLLGFGW